MPEVVSTARRTGRAELDEHVQGVESAEIDVDLQMKDRPKEAVLTEMREKVTLLPGTNVSIGQPISHRIDRGCAADLRTGHKYLMILVEREDAPGRLVKAAVRLADRDTIVFPGYDGGAEWGGSAFDPESALLYVNANEMAWTGALAANERGGGGRQTYLRQCASCHRDGGIAPFALTSYQAVAAASKAVQTAVSTRKMPPWLADDACADYANDPTLSDEEIATMSEWVDELDK